MPLSQLADEIVRQSRQMTCTPVLVTPSYMSLRTPFFVQLVDAVWQRSRRAVRIDWYRDPGTHLLGWLATAWARQQARAINRCLRESTAARRRADLTSLGSIAVTASIARPDSRSNQVVVGLCHDRMKLPSWCSAIRLYGWPIALDSLAGV
jgi:hypothetical protein